MKNIIKEILTHEIFLKEEHCEIAIPVQNLVEPSFLLDRRDLYIFLYHQTQAFVLRNLDEHIVEFIIAKKCYIVESLLFEQRHQFLINLDPKA
jgi:hypothetical protein